MDIKRIYSTHRSGAQTDRPMFSSFTVYPRDCPDGADRGEELCKPTRSDRSAFFAHAKQKKRAAVSPGSLHRRIEMGCYS